MIKKRLKLVDKKSGEPIIGATIFTPDFTFGTITDESGYFLIDVDSNTDTIIISHLNYTDENHAIQTLLNSKIIKLNQVNTYISEITITDKNPKKFDMEKAANGYFSSNQLLYKYVMMDNDPVRHIMQFSGVQSGREGQNLLYVRGGSPDQNLVLFDGSPLFETSHILGLTSIFNKNTIKNIGVYKHGFPSKYGDKLTSVVTIDAKNGNNQEIHGNAELSPISANISLEGPIIKDKISFQVAGRKSLVNKTLGSIINDQLNFDHSNFSFYDLIGKLSFSISEQQILSFHYLNSNDEMSFNATENIEDGINQLGVTKQDDISGIQNWVD